MLAWVVTKPSGAQRPYLSWQSGGSLRAMAACLSSFLFYLSTWHRAEHAAETSQRLALEIKKPKIRNSIGFQSRKTCERGWREEGLFPLDWEGHKLRIPQAQWGFLTAQQYKWDSKSIGIQGVLEAGMFSPLSSRSVWSSCQCSAFPMIHLYVHVSLAAPITNQPDDPYSEIRLAH